MLYRYETTASALNFTTYLLAKHPEVQQRLQQEIDAKFGEHTRYGNLTKEQAFLTEFFSECRSKCLFF